MKNLFTACFLFIACSFTAFATHIRGGYISVEKVEALTFRFTFHGFRDKGSTIPIGGGTFRFGDDRQVENVISEVDIITFDLSPEIELVEFSLIHSYQKEGKYTVSYEEEYRNTEILNMSNSEMTSFYVETRFTTRVDNSSPTFDAYDILADFQMGELNVRDLSVQDEHNDLLQYRLVVPMQSRNIEVNNYTLPNDPRFYSDHSAGNYAGDGEPVFTLNEVTGTLVWDTPGNGHGDNRHIHHYSNMYSIAISVDEFQNNNDTLRWVSSTTVDLVLTVEDFTEKLSVIPNIRTFCTDTLMSFRVESDGPYTLEVDPVTAISSMNGSPVQDLLDSTFTSNATFEVKFNAMQEGEYVRFGVKTENEEEMSFRYIVSDQCTEDGYEPDYVYYLSVSEEQKDRLKLFPNPASENLWISPVHQDLTYAIFGMDGKLISTGLLKAGDQNQEISVSRLEGIYLIRFTSNDHQYTQTEKLVIKN